MTNEEIANLLYQYAELLEASGANPYRTRAYKRAARSIIRYENNVAQEVKEKKDITHIDWIGINIAKVIDEIVSTGKLPAIHKSLKEKQLNELKKITALSDKRIAMLNKEFKIYTIKELLAAIKSNTLSHISWFKKPLIKLILEEIANPKPNKKFLRLYHAIPIVSAIETYLLNLTDVIAATCAGAYRRKQELLEENLKFVVATNSPNIIKDILRFEAISDLLEQNTNHLLVKLWVGINAEFYIVTPESYATHLFYLTGSEAHLLALEKYANDKKIEINLRGKAFSTLDEHPIYKALSLNYIAPELRENRGEIEAAHTNELPTLITYADIKGDLHTHTNETDGREPLEVMVNAAIEKGYEYYAITDHSKRLAITNGLDEKRLLAQIKAIDKLNEKQNKILILKSIEVDILEDGSLDLSNDVLKELDIVVASIHSKFRIPEEKQTTRIIKAMDNPYFNILGHATGRLIKSRNPYSIDLEKILRAAKERNCFIELNSQPYRLDIKDNYCQLAKSFGIKIAISSDAHSIRELNFLSFGVFQARRGWLRKEDVLNTYPWRDLKKIIKRS